jgi:hypothetical protein
MGDGIRIGADASGFVVTPLRRDGPPSAAQTSVSFRFEGSAQVEPSGEGKRAALYHFLIGNDPDRWRSNVHAFDKVAWTSLYPGIDVRLDGTNSQLTLSLTFAPGVSPNLAVVRCDGVELTPMGDDGLLELRVGPGSLRVGGVRSWQDAGQQGRRDVPCALKAIGPHGFGFAAGDTDPQYPVIILAGLEWSTFLGDEGTAESVDALDLSGDGGVTVAGITPSFDFPVTAGAFDETYGGGTGSSPSDVFVAHLDPTGSQLEWATYLGGSNNEEPAAVIVRPDGSAVVAGRTVSLDFPTTPGVLKETNPFEVDGFIASLAADGSGLEFSSFFGGSLSDRIRGLAVDSDGQLLVTGITDSPDFPVTANTFQATLAGATDAFVAKIASDCTSVSFASYLGGSKGDVGIGIAPASEGRVYLTGTTSSTDFPTTLGAFDAQLTGFFGDAFVSSVNVDAGSLLASTYLGGDTRDTPSGIAVDPSGLVVVVGDTEGSDAPFFADFFPTTSDAFDPTFNAFDDAFVSKFDPDLQTLIYSTFVGSPRRDFARAMLMETSGAVIVAGITDSNGFPVTVGCLQPTKGAPLNDVYDMFVFRLAPAGDTLHYSTFFGGTGQEECQQLGLAVDAAGAVTLGGWSVADDFPTTPGSYDPTKPPGSLAQAVIARLSMLPLGAEAYGLSTPGRSGPLTIGVTSMPQLGSETFALTCSNAPPLGLGLLAISGASLATPVGAGGAQVWIDPAALLLLLPDVSDAVGYSELPLRIAADPSLTGFQAFVEYFWKSQGPGGLQASNGLALTVQP